MDCFFFISKEQVLSECQKRRRDALKNALVIDGQVVPAPGAFVPMCETDGRFSEVQCHPSVGECWCVKENGDAREETRTRAGKPPCASK